MQGNPVDCTYFSFKIACYLVFLWIQITEKIVNRLLVSTWFLKNSIVKAPGEHSRNGMEKVNVGFSKMEDASCWSQSITQSNHRLLVFVCGKQQMCIILVQTVLVIRSCVHLNITLNQKYHSRTQSKILLFLSYPLLFSRYILGVGSSTAVSFFL